MDEKFKHSDEDEIEVTSTEDEGESIDVRRFDDAEDSDDDIAREFKKDVSDDQEDSYVDSLDEDESEDETTAGSDDTEETAVEKSDAKYASTNDAVDAIVREEGDRLMQSEDDAREHRFDPPKEKTGFFGKIKKGFSFWWNHKKFRNLTLLVIFLGISAAIFLPVSRYFLLNTAGVRVRTSLSVVDSHTNLPLKNIPVELQGQSARTNDDGYVEFHNLRLGKSRLVIQKLGYAHIDRTLTLGWGSNPLGNQPLAATGTQFTFVLSDWLGGKPLEGGEVTSGEDVAKSDKEGKVVLTVGELNEDTEATVSADSYRTEKVKLSAVSADQKVTMVPAKKHLFVSNRDGHYDLYKIDVDGKNEEILLKSSGKEREIPHVQPHPSRDIAAYISTRDGEVNSSGFIFDGLFIVDVKTGESKRIARSEQIQLLGWDKDKLVYIAIVEGVSAGNPERSKIYSYDINTAEKKELASSNYFNDAKLIGDKIYYAVSSYGVPQSSAKLFTIKPDATEKKTVLDYQVWDIVVASPHMLYFRAVDDKLATVWYSSENFGLPQKLDAPPVIQTSRYYTYSPKGEDALWIDQRDGKGVLLSVHVQDGTEKTVQSAPGLSDPVYWANDRTIVYRVATNQESADYIMSLDGGEAHKIADVIGNRSKYFN